jgi:serine/alanine adding enzyme
VSLHVTRWDGTAAAWDAAVRSQSGWTHFHLAGWKEVIAETLGHECLYFAAREGEDVRGVLPIVRVRSALFGHYLVSMPFVNYGGPLGDTEAVQALAAHVTQLARQERVKLLELRSRASLPLDLPVSHRKITVVLDLPGESATLWRALGSKLRSQIKRPQKEGLTVRFGPDQVDPFYWVFAEHMRDLGTPVMPHAFFRAVAKVFGDEAWFGCVYHGAQPVAGGAGFRWGAELELTWASSLGTYSRIAPNMLLYWSFLERAIEAQVRTFNFGRCTPDGGTHRFKRQWGSRDETLWWYQLSQGAAGTPSPDDAKYRWGPRLWRKLPLPVATALGPRIVRFIP